VFAESLAKGVHQFEIELEPGYKGSFTINPAKAVLMYFSLLHLKVGYFALIIVPSSN
jgi:hypothetical protein